MRNSHALFLGLFWLGNMSLQPKSYASEVKTISLDNKQIAQVSVSLRGTVISFPAKPSKVILGNADSFGLEYVENDVAVSPLKLNAQSNLFVYLYGRRFALALKSSAQGASLVIVRDALAEVGNGRP